MKLHVRSFWHTLKGGKDGLKFWGSEDHHEGNGFPMVIHHISNDTNVHQSLPIENLESWKGAIRRYRRMKRRLVRLLQLKMTKGRGTWARREKSFNGAGSAGTPPFSPTARRKI